MYELLASSLAGITQHIMRPSMKGIVMNKINVKEFKNKAKTHAPAIIAGVVVGVIATSIVANRMYHPKGKIAIQFPAGVLEKMRGEGKGLALNTNEGWFTLKYHSN